VFGVPQICRHLGGVAFCSAEDARGSVCEPIDEYEIVLLILLELEQDIVGPMIEL
jgi:hypothetical protein